MVGRVGVEPTTSRLSGVRSNHLSYRPLLLACLKRRRQHPLPWLSSHKLGRAVALAAEGTVLRWLISRMKGHEDGGNVLWKRRKHSRANSGAFRHDP